MAQTDTIADFITSIRNASGAKKETLECGSSNIRKGVSDILKREGFIRDFRVMKEARREALKIYLKYSKGKDKLPAITNIKRVSKPSLRVYRKISAVPSILGGRGLAVISTSKGILTDRECRELNIGGEVLFYIW